MTDVSSTSSAGDRPKDTEAVQTEAPSAVAPADATVDVSEDNGVVPGAEQVAEGSEVFSEEPSSDALSPDAAGDDTAEAAGRGTSSAGSRLEEEGDIAADYVEELLDISDIDGDIDIEVRNGRTYVSVIAEDGDERLRDLVGPEGKGLEALQELVRLAVLSATGNRSRLVLDLAGHRSRRSTELETEAQDAVERVRDSGEPVHLKPMGAYERKVVHDVIAAAGLVSESEGEGPRRHVVVSTGD